MTQLSTQPKISHNMFTLPVVVRIRLIVVRRGREQLLILEGRVIRWNELQDGDMTLGVDVVDRCGEVDGDQTNRGLSQSFHATIHYHLAVFSITVPNTAVADSATHLTHARSALNTHQLPTHHNGG